MTIIWRVHAVCEVCGVRINVTFTPDEVRAAITAHIQTCPTTQAFNLKMVPFEQVMPPTIISPPLPEPVTP
jgi:hypothetical protein